VPSYYAQMACARTGTSVPVLRGWEMYHLKGSPSIESYLRFPGNGLVRPTHPTLERRRRDVGAVGNQFNYDGVPGTHQWYDGTPHPWEFARCGTSNRR